MSRTIIDLTDIGDDRFKRWAKTVKRVNTSLATGYAFEGEFIGIGRKHELPVGSYVLVYAELGSMRHHHPSVQLWKVTETGHDVVYKRERLNPSWALEVRDDIAAIINAAPELAEEPNPLAAVPDSDLVAEVERRGYFIARADTDEV
mgnify:CR=1 FL=1